MKLLIYITSVLLLLFTGCSNDGSLNSDSTALKSVKSSKKELSALTLTVASKDYVATIFGRTITVLLDTDVALPTSVVVKAVTISPKARGISVNDLLVLSAGSTSVTIIAEDGTIKGHNIVFTLSYTVSFDTGAGSSVPPIMVDHGTMASEPAAPRRTSYIFIDWVTTYGGDTVFDFSTPITAARTFYAKWTINTHTVSFHSNGGSAIADVVVDHRDTVSKPTDPTRTNYIFYDWVVISGGSTVFDFSTPITVDTTIYAKWLIGSYTVIFHTARGSAIPVTMVDHQSVVRRPIDPIRTGYTFVNWVMTNGGSTVFDFSTPITSNTKLYAKWSIDNGYTVTFDSTGGILVPSVEVVHGNTVRKPADPTHTTSVFDNWVTTNGGSTVFNFTTPITAPITLYAKWTINTHTVKFYGGIGFPVKTVVVNHGSRVRRPPDPVRTGFTFMGWKRTIHLPAMFNFTAPITADKIVYADWKTKIYTVTFDSNGGSAISDVTVTHGSRAPIPTRPTRPGKSFVDWVIRGTNIKFFFSDPIIADTAVFVLWR